MDAIENSESLRALHQTLTLLNNGRKVDLSILCTQLEVHIAAFKALIDKKPKDANSRKKLSTGKVGIDGVEYELNSQFQEQVIQLADSLDLDEIQATQLYMLGQQEAEQLDRQPLTCAIIRFHQYRSYLLDCLRLTCALAMDDELDEAYRSLFVECVALIVKPEGSQTYIQRCIRAMATVETWLQNIAEQVQKNVTLNINPNRDTEETMHVQQENLIQEHESLAMIVTYLINSNKAAESDFSEALNHMSTVDKWNGVTVHYVPVLLSFAAHFGRSYSPSVNFDEAKALNVRILETRDSKPWPLRHLQAAFISWWLSEYNGWFFDQGAGSQSDTKADEATREAAFKQSLDDGAFQCTLAVCAYLKSQDWLDPSRLALTRSLLTESMTVPVDTFSRQPKFEVIVMEQLEIFLDSFICNMPDVLRTSKTEADDERRRLFAGTANGVPTASSRFLETFFLIVSYAFDGRPSAAELFWHDPESNMYGFLQWASRRQTTPVVAAFCEMFRAISEGPRFAEAAHNFLLGDASVSSSRMQKAVTLSWAQIFEELDFYSSKIRQSTTPVPVATGSGGGGFNANEDMDEPESNEMLECYLRLISHLCRQSNLVRDFLLGQQRFSIIDTTLYLCRKQAVGRVRMTAYNCLAALLTDKSLDVGEHIWAAVDRWLTSEFCPKPPPRAGHGVSIEDVAFQTIGSSAEESNAFLTLLQALVAPFQSINGLRDALPFPEGLGSAYRLPGLDSYVDFVFGRLLCHTLPAAHGTLQAQILAANILTFAVICLESFNEDLVILANRSNINVDSCINASSLTNYVRLHPFNRVMEWMFNERALRVLFQISHHDIADLNSCASESPLVNSVFHSVRLISLIMKLEPTYLNIVRPLVKAQPYSRKETVLDASIAVFEDNIATHLRIVPDLLYYTGSGHHQLALASMHLLATIMSSKRLNLNTPGRFGKVAANRMISLLQQNEDVEPIARSLMHAMEIDPRDLDVEEFEAGQQPQTYQTKLAILNFLEMTLKELPDKANLAHVLLGLDCVDATLWVSEESLFARGESLFHAILRTAFDIPEMQEGTFRTSSLILREKVWQIIELLWSSPISSAPILEDLRENRYGSSRWIQQQLLTMHTSWDHITLLQDNAPFSSLVDALYSYLEQRQSLFKYTAMELRMTAHQDLELARARITSTTLGLTVFEDGEVANPSLFDLLDFMEIELPPLMLPPLQYLSDIEVGLRNLSDVMDSNLEQDMNMVENLLMLKIQDLRSNGKIPDASAEAIVDTEAGGVRTFLEAKAKLSALTELRLETLRAWVNMLSVFIGSGLLDDNTRQDIVLQAIQSTTPKLDFYAQAGRPETLVFAQLSQTLLANLDLSQTEGSRADDGTNERLFNLFRVSLRAAVVPMADAPVRAALYSICYKYLSSSSDEKVTSRCMSTVKTMSEGLIETMCDDAYSGDGSCRLSALMLLDAFASIEISSSSSANGSGNGSTPASSSSGTHVLETMGRANFVVVLTEAIERMPQEVQNSNASEVPGLLAYYHAKLSLLLTLARTRQGAAEVFNAGLFPAVAGSGLFGTDPDIGLDIDSPDALLRYYELLCAVLRLIVAVVVSRGAKNTQSVDQARTFLTRNKYLMIGLLKRQARIGLAAQQQEEDQAEGKNGAALTNGSKKANATEKSGGEAGENARKEREKEKEKRAAAMQNVLNEISELFVLLVSVTGMIEEEEQLDTRKTRRKVYS